MFYAYVPHRSGWLFLMTLGDRSAWHYTFDPNYAHGFATAEEAVAVLRAESVGPADYQIIRMEFA